MREKNTNTKTARYEVDIVSVRQRFGRLIRNLVVIAVLAAIGLGLRSYMEMVNPVESGSELNDVINEIVILQQSVGDLYPNQTEYNGLDDDVVITGGGLPVSMVSGTRITHSLGGYLHVASIENGGWLLTVDDLPLWACIRLATQSHWDSALSIRASSGNGESKTSGPQMSLSAAEMGCGNGQTKSRVELTFH